MAVKEEKIEMNGVVIDASRSGTRRVALEGRPHEVLAYMAGKMRVDVRPPGRSEWLERR